MQTDNKFLDDFAKLATGAMGGVQQLKNDMQQFFRTQMDHWLQGQNLVARDEFEVVKAMAAAAREENEILKARIEALEEKISGKTK